MWEEEKVVYELGQAVAKVAKRKFVGKKPVLGKLPAVILRPKVLSAAEEDSMDGDNGDNGDDNENEEND